MPDTLDHVAQARAIYAELCDLRMVDMTKDQWNLLLALEAVFDPKIVRARQAEEGLKARPRYDRPRVASPQA